MGIARPMGYTGCNSDELQVHVGMTGPRVAIRVDGSTQIGSGHVLRCLALAEALRSAGAAVRIVLREHDVSFFDRLSESRFEVDLLRRPGSSDVPTDAAAPHGLWLGVEEAVDAAETTAVLENWRPDWVVIDHYGITAAWHDHVREALGCRLLAVDDVADRPLAADLILDHNPDADHRLKYARRNDRDAPILGGPRFALLSAAYRDAAPCQWRDEVRSIGVFLGGVDRDNTSAVALASARNAGFDGPIEIVSTSANPRLAELEAAVAADARASLTLDLPNLAAFFAAHDLQIGAGGGASWERCRMGAPAIVLRCAENQKVVTAALRAADAAVTVDDPSDVHLTEAVAALLANPGLRARIAANALALVDGRGAQRVALAMLGPWLTVRRAGPADSELVHAWRNHPSVRAVSRNADEIALDAHRAWFAGAIVDPDRSFLIGTIGETPVGVVRYDPVARGEVEVSIYLDSALQGLGLGSRLLSAGEGWLADHRPEVTTVVAEFLGSNDTSRRLFERAGFSGPGNRVRKALRGSSASTEMSAYS